MVPAGRVAMDTSPLALNHKRKHGMNIIREEIAPKRKDRYKIASCEKK